MKICDYVMSKVEQFSDGGAVLDLNAFRDFEELMEIMDYVLRPESLNEVIDADAEIRKTGNTLMPYEIVVSIKIADEILLGNWHDEMLLLKVFSHAKSLKFSHAGNCGESTVLKVEMVFDGCWWVYSFDKSVT